MKKITVCLITVLAFSCSHSIDDNHTVSSENEMARHDEIRKILDEYWSRDNESFQKKYGVKVKRD
jgi:hypothetical protein